MSLQCVKASYKEGVFGYRNLFVAGSNDTRLIARILWHILEGIVQPQGFELRSRFKIAEIQLDSTIYTFQNRWAFFKLRNDKLIFPSRFLIHFGREIELPRDQILEFWMSDQEHDAKR